MDCSHSAPLSVVSSRQEYWSGLPFPSPGDLPDPGIEPVSPASHALQMYSLPAEPSGKRGDPITTPFIQVLRQGDISVLGQTIERWPVDDRSGT